MDYCEIEPHRTLRPFVRCLWSMHSPECTPSPDVDRIIPDGCPEIIICRADAFSRHLDDGTFRRQAAALLVGQFQRAIAIAATGRVDLIGVRFEPGGLYALLGIPMHSITNCDLDLAQVEPRLRDALVDATRGDTLRDCAGELETALTRQYLRRRKSGMPRPGLVASAVQIASNRCDSTRQLAATLGVHTRALERLFRTEVGLSPKRFLRIQRLQSVLRHVDAPGSTRNWSQIASTHGYTDQSHLIRDFRLLADTTPERYINDRSEFAASFDGNDLSHSSNR